MMKITLFLILMAAVVDAAPPTMNRGRFNPQDIHQRKQDYMNRHGGRGMPRRSSPYDRFRGRPGFPGYQEDEIECRNSVDSQGNAVTDCPQGARIPQYPANCKVESNQQGGVRITCPKK